MVLNYTTLCDARAPFAVWCPTLCDALPPALKAPPSSSSPRGVIVDVIPLSLRLLVRPWNCHADALPTGDTGKAEDEDGVLVAVDAADDEAIIRAFRSDRLPPPASASSEVKENNA